MRTLWKLAALTLSISLLSTSVFAFSDVPDNHPNYQAIMYLKDHGVVQGYDDNTYKPEQSVRRGEAAKIILEPIYKDLEVPTENPLPDVATTEWYAKYVKKGYDLEIIKGDDETGFFDGGRKVNLVEYLKMLLLAFGADVSEYQNPSIALFADATDLAQWYIPFLHYAGSTNIVHGNSDNNIFPGAYLTRGEVAEITYRLIVNLQGGEVQLHLSMTEAEMIKILQYLDVNDIDNAEIASANALKYSNDAHDLAPEESIVAAAVKIAEAFDKLVKAYRAGQEETYEDVERFAGEAWNLANEAEGIDSSIMSLSNSLKEISHTMAEEARVILEASS